MRGAEETPPGRRTPSRLRRGVLGLLVVVAGALAACRSTAPAVDSEPYREPEGRFEILRPAGWALARTVQDGVSFWRFTPQPLPDPAADAEAELTVALVPLPARPENELNPASLEQVGKYVRDILLQTAARAGLSFRAGPAQRDRVGERDAVRYDLRGRDAAGAEQRVTVLTMRGEGGAIVISFSGPAAREADLFPRLERCARSFRIGGAGR